MKPSKLCRFCKQENKELTLADRNWTCHHCGKELERDINAAINIKNEGCRILRNYTDVSWYVTTELKLFLRGMDMFIFAIYGLYSIVSLILVYATATLFFGYQLSGSWPCFCGTYLLVMLSMFSIGLLVGGVAPNIKTASVLASVLYFPMLIFSGATLPYEVMPAALQKVSDILPLTQGIKLLKSASLGLLTDSVLVPVAVLTVLAVVCISVSIRFFKWE